MILQNSTNQQWNNVRNWICCVAHSMMEETSIVFVTVKGELGLRQLSKRQVPTVVDFQCMITPLSKHSVRTFSNLATVPLPQIQQQLQRTRKGQSPVPYCILFFVCCAMIYSGPYYFALLRRCPALEKSNWCRVSELCWRPSHLKRSVLAFYWFITCWRNTGYVLLKFRQLWQRSPLLRGKGSQCVCVKRRVEYGE